MYVNPFWFGFGVGIVITIAIIVFVALMTNPAEDAEWMEEQKDEKDHK